MRWDADGFTKRLSQAASSFDRPGAEALCRELAKHVVEARKPYPADPARRALQLLRNKRWFDLLDRTADVPSSRR
jgi:hypothetical protein